MVGFSLFGGATYLIYVAKQRRQRNGDESFQRHSDVSNERQSDSLKSVEHEPGKEAVVGLATSELAEKIDKIEDAKFETLDLASSEGDENSPDASESRIVIRRG